MKRTAQFSADRSYRYALTRAWDETLPRLTWILLNPSRADEDADDPTIRRVIGLSRGWGYGSARVMNLYARVCTCPAELQRNFSERERIGPRNDRHLGEVHGPVVVAWGAHAYAHERAQAVLAKLPRPLFCLAQNRDGSPKHPLYARKDSQLTPYIS